VVRSRISTKLRISTSSRLMWVWRMLIWMRVLDLVRRPMKSRRARSCWRINLSSRLVSLCLSRLGKRAWTCKNWLNTSNFSKRTKILQDTDARSHYSSQPHNSRGTQMLSSRPQRCQSGNVWIRAFNLWTVLPYRLESNRSLRTISQLRLASKLKSF
jgi:hypothetical protein